MTCEVPKPDSEGPSVDASWLSSGSAVDVDWNEEVDDSVSVGLTLGEKVRLPVAVTSVVGSGFVEVVSLVDDEGGSVAGGARITPPAVPVLTNVASSAVCVG